jgi:predicted transcriptional regulator
MLLAYQGTYPMPAEKLENQRNRYTVELNDRLDHVLDSLAQEHGSSKAEIIRFAIDFMNAGMEAKKSGLKVGGWKDNEKGEIVKERVFVGL